jgi:hypothetical protein
MDVIYGYPEVTTSGAGTGNGCESSDETEGEIKL